MKRMKTRKGQTTIPQKNPILHRAKQMINEKPGIYPGNLHYWLLREYKKVDMEKIMNLLALEGYEEKKGLLYPPGTVEEEYKLLKRFYIKKETITEEDFKILVRAWELEGEDVERIISKALSYDFIPERESKRRIVDLALKGYLIIDDKGRTRINWSKIRKEEKR